MFLKRLIKVSVLSFWFLALLTFSSCEAQEPEPQPEPIPEKFIFKAADLSFLPDIEASGAIFYNREGQAEDMLTTLKEAGMNAVRIRLWHTPADGISGFEEVKAFAEKVRERGLKVWLTVHYSDTWADPGNQQPPAAWANLDINALSDSMYAYTSKIITGISPDYIQIGNEINHGMLWPLGNTENMGNLVRLLKSGADAVRDNDKDCKIILQYAGTDGAKWFLNAVKEMDFDIIGISYYPNWHGKDLGKLETDLKELASYSQKPVMIAETSYPFTFDWNDWTNNVIGGADKIIPGIPASESGQLSFMKEVKRISTSTSQLVGFAYWGGEWISYKGPQATNGSSWENQAFYNFNNHALPVIEVFN
jgi:arabinogalactan endo-1,4-beta-galactosidase